MTTAAAAATDAPAMLALDSAGRVPPAQQTRVAAFLMSAHGAHARRLAASLAGPVQDGGQILLHTEYCREMEIVSLLARSTSWTFDPVLPLLALRWEAAWLPAPVSPPGDPLQDLAIDLSAFGHALYGGIRPVTRIPTGGDASAPFALALGALEFESSRLIQGQIAFLKSPALISRRDAASAALDARRSQMRALWDELLKGLSP